MQTNNHSHPAGADLQDSVSSAFIFTIMKSAFFLAACLVTVAVAAQQPIRYDVSFPNFQHHEAQIRFAVPHAKGPTTFRMSRSSPGRYATHEFGKNVYNVKAYDSATGRAVDVIQKDGDIYTAMYSYGTLVVEYTLFGDLVDGTYAAIDRNHAHLNIPASFMWVIGRDRQPVIVHYDVPPASNWKVATQMKPLGNDNTFWAPDLQLFMDSPTELSDFKMRTWTAKDVNGKEKLFRIALHGDITDDLMDEFTGNVKKVVEEARSVFGQWPDFDFGVYTFIIDLQPRNNGDGMEHRNSTCITGRAGKLTHEKMLSELSTVSHEFFHCWNVERIRPKTIEPFNFTKSNMSDELWVAEGFTQYYGELILARAGLQSNEDFLGALGYYVNGFMNYPGAKYHTPIESSRLAIYTDAATAIDKTNFGNQFYSYYLYGASLASVLDLTLRSQFNKTLDDFMKLMWNRYGKTGVPYTVANLQETLATLTNTSFAATFFDEYVHHSNRTSLAPLFATVGISVVNPNAGQASMGILNVKPADDGAEIITTVQKGSPLYVAGLETGDIINSLDGQSVKSMADITAFLKNKKPGDRIRVMFNSRGQSLPTTVVAAEATGLELSVDEHADSAQLQARKRWLGSAQ